MKTVYIHCLVWNNDAQYLADFFASIEAQTYSAHSVRLLDNGSTDGTGEVVREQYSRALVARNVKNRGFAPGHNQLFTYTSTHLVDEQDDDPFVLLTNPDVMYAPDMIQKLVDALKANNKLAAVQPKVFRAFQASGEDADIIGPEKSDILDTTGLRLGKGWSMSDRGAGEMDEGQYDQDTDLFGPAGAIALLRLKALQDVAFEGEVFDGDFHTYREDCDLAWRLQRAGWKTHFVPKAHAWHYRGMYGAEKMSIWKRLMNRRGQRPFFAALSTRNQLLMMLKNLPFSDAIRALPWIVLQQGSRIGYSLLFEKQTRRRLMEIPGLLPRMRKKRKLVKELTRADLADIRKYRS